MDKSSAWSDFSLRSLKCFKDKSSAWSDFLLRSLKCFKDKSSAWSDFSLWFLKCFTAHAVENLNIKTEKSEQTLFAQISLSQY